MVSINDLVEELKDATRWQVTPEPLFDEDYRSMIVSGIKKLYVDTNRPDSYDPSLFHTEIIDEETDGLFYDAELDVIEQSYILIVSQIAFFKRVQADVNNRFGYSTDALTITNADKPYANLKDTISNLENERRIIYYKMITYTIG